MTRKDFIKERLTPLGRRMNPTSPCPAYLLSLGLGLPWPVNSAAFGICGLLQITPFSTHCYPEKIPMFPAFPISWGLHWLLSITFIAWHTVHSGAPCRDFWQEQETDTTSQSVLRYRTPPPKKMPWLKAGNDPDHADNSWLGQLDRPAYLPCCVSPISARSPIEIL